MHIHEAQGSKTMESCTKSCAALFVVEVVVIPGHLDRKKNRLVSVETLRSATLDSNQSRDSHYGYCYYTLVPLHSSSKFMIITTYNK